jgi:hypothetical protein
MARFGRHGKLLSAKTRFCSNLMMQGLASSRQDQLANCRIAPSLPIGSIRKNRSMAISFKRSPPHEQAGMLRIGDN